jgi:hypothetical protein
LAVRIYIEKITRNGRTSHTELIVAFRYHIGI